MKELRNKEISELRLNGFTLAKIGEIYNLTRERVRQILSELGIQKPQSVKVKISYDEKIRQRIINNIKETDNNCWIWQKTKTPLGYGTMSYKGYKQYVHRVSYTVFKDSVINKDMNVIRSCKHRDCVNPNHLLLDKKIL